MPKKTVEVTAGTPIVPRNKKVLRENKINNYLIRYLIKDQSFLVFLWDYSKWLEKITY
ncbi:hypothetical protein [Mycoplasma ovis]|uniref:hypothetical protein n=1 Tax=Mycoplasma ovis TaxID=171632 RepID=UPI0003FF7CEC|nr:hypothetical protein [Mycoplasma ovis]